MLLKFFSSTYNYQKILTVSRYRALRKGRHAVTCNNNQNVTLKTKPKNRNKAGEQPEQNAPKSSSS